ncbi:hypothetical protein [Cerasicoccus arenae]|uniref:Uncharacterized protein n=1 Tax=Cerasicoccus arenae TaxID=424488 RepID=A0A8J3DI81_9BACT|nr:hypothetical protein [Cerasicoccus arenae]MBK1858469.1 hypothetical protein [Cerasicoccus arenae]GHC10463.1 hypothetical protein GCM10007047_29770 [Cerasicoccus arenae]
MDTLTPEKAHRHFAAEAFNQCWEFMNLPVRTPEENRRMIRAAETSFWHWQFAPERTPQNDAVSYWQLSRVYALTGDVTTGIHYAQLGITTAQEHKLSAFYLGYAWESAARAYLLAGMASKGQEALHKARTAAFRVKDLADKAALELDLMNLSPMNETVGSAIA